MLHATLSALVISAAALAAPGDAPSAANDTIVVKHCLVGMKEKWKLSPSDAGLLLRRHVDIGAVVEKGQPLANIDDREAHIKKEAAQAEVDVALKQASSDVNVRAAEKMAQVAEQEYLQAVAINNKSPGVISLMELRRLKLTWERGILQREVAELEMAVAELTATAKRAAVRAADNEIQRRQIVAPADAIVDRVLVSENEWVQPGQPIFELVRIDELRVEAFLNASEVSPHEVEGRPVVVEIQVKDPETKKIVTKSFESTVTFVSRQVVADGSFRIATDFDNRRIDQNWEVWPGLTANLKIKLDGPVQTVSTPAKKPAVSAPKLTPTSNK